MGVIGVLLSLFGLIYLAYRGINVLILAPLMALVAVLFHPGTPPLATYTQIYMPALGQYLLKYFPIFLLGSIFGKVMSDSGAAEIIGETLAKKVGSHRAILAVVLACAVLTYGGVSLFVVAFCVYPISIVLFKQANIPRRLIPGSIALGSFTFTMTALPGTPAIQNAIPMPHFGTTTFAAPILGLIGGAIMFFVGWQWLELRAKKARANSEGFLDADEISAAKTSTSESTSTQNSHVKGNENSHANHLGNRPSFWVAITPLLAVLIINYLLSEYWFPQLEAPYLAMKEYGNVSLKSVIGLWALIVALTLGIFVSCLMMFRYLRNPISTLNDGTMGSLLPIFNTASEVGYGSIIAFLPSFALIKSSVLTILPQYPLISESIAINVLAGITGSASGGLSIALEALGKTYLEMAQAANISPELLHRVASMSSGGFDTLPHNGAVITLLAICSLTHKKSYLDIFMVAVAAPVVGTIAVIALGTVLGSF